MSVSLTAPDFRAHPHLYEINTWVWLNDLSRRLGRRVRIGDVPAHEWDSLKEKGFDGIWLMGIWERSPRGRDIAAQDPSLQIAYKKALPDWQPHDVVGSPYAVHAYRPDPALGTWEQLAAVLNALHDRGLRLILDFVPNHTALDHEWVTTHPDRYIQGTAAQYAQSPSSYFSVTVRGTPTYLAHGKDPHFPSWTDTAQLNYFNPDTRSAVLKELRTLAGFCDGFRCDMAMLILNDVFARTWESHGITDGPPPSQEFWTEALTQFPSWTWIAEAYWNREWDLQQLGFHYTYDKTLYDLLRHAGPADVARHLKADVSYQTKLVRFLENHDEPRSASVFGNVRLPAIGTLMSTLPGMRLYHQGQLEGRRIYLPIQFGRGPEESPDLDTMDLYDRLLRITNKDVFHKGQWSSVPSRPAGDSSFQGLIAYAWHTSTECSLVVTNLQATVAQGFLPLNEALPDFLDRARTYLLYDRLNDQEYSRRGEELSQRGLFIRLDPFGAHLFTIRVSGVS